MPPTVEEGSFNTSDGTNLYTKTWKPEGRPAGVIIFVHGFSDHCSAYNALFTNLATHHALQTHSFDQRGWGRSVRQPSERGLTGPTAQVLTDLHDFVLHTLTQFSAPNQLPPLFLMGASMGGAIALHYTLYTLRSTSIRNRPAFAGLLLEAPFIALAPESAPHWFTVKAGKMASKLLPSKQLAQKLDAASMCRDRAVCDEWAADPLCHDTGTLGGLAGMLQRAADLQALSEGAYVRTLTNELPCPVWIGHGDGDKLTSCKASQRLCGVLSAPGGDRMMRVYDGAYHKLDREPDGVGEQFAREVGEWCVRRANGHRGALDHNGRKSLHVSRSHGEGSPAATPGVSGNGATKL